jgi:hypothetical protein
MASPLASLRTAGLDAAVGAQPSIAAPKPNATYSNPMDNIRGSSRGVEGLAGASQAAGGIGIDKGQKPLLMGGATPNMTTGASFIPMKDDPTLKQKPLAGQGQGQGAVAALGAKIPVGNTSQVGLAPTGSKVPQELSALAASNPSILAMLQKAGLM